MKSDRFSPEAPNNAADAASVSERGIDEYGTYVDLYVQNSHGKVMQRLRWIEPGTFLMGSPNSEAERWDDEGPQHSVTLTKGYWLADTACTQALWQAVMGNNPSWFKDDVQSPVENVSWDDVQPFLRALEALLPGVEACLPTEAQWEYACRAGTTTAFSFGDQITSEQVNYDGDYPYAGGKESKYRGRTLPVKSLPINAWGLYEMHGNVNEWCADGLRIYDATQQQDPLGPIDSPQRALRGGSWLNDARDARSAYRFDSGSGRRRDYLGFRLCLNDSPVL